MWPLYHTFSIERRNRPLEGCQLTAKYRFVLRKSVFSVRISKLQTSKGRAKHHSESPSWMYLCRMSFHCFCQRGEQIVEEAREPSTYSAVPRVPKVGYGDIETDAECEGSNKYGRHVDTCEK